MSIKILPPTRHIFRSKGDGDSKDLKALMDTRNKHIPREGGREGARKGAAGWSVVIYFRRDLFEISGRRAQSGGLVGWVLFPPVSRSSGVSKPQK